MKKSELEMALDSARQGLALAREREADALAEVERLISDRNAEKKMRKDAEDRATTLEEELEGLKHTPQTEAQRKALDAVFKEREYQKERWRPEHDAKHTPEEWHIILSVWMGKLANETPLFQGDDTFKKAKFLNRLAQIGAIAIAAYEALSASPE